MAKDEVLVCKTFSFDSSHQLVGHFGKCSNLHGHTYKLEVKVKDVPQAHYGEASSSLGEAVNSSEGFVVDFYHLKTIVNDLIVEPLDHAFIAMGNEPVIEVLRNTGAKMVILGFRTTVENMCRYICWRLMKADLAVHSVRMWETPTGWAECLAEDIDIHKGPNYRTIGGCDLD